MYYNNTEVDNAPQATDEHLKPTWQETLEAGYKNITSVGISVSEMNYFQNEITQETEKIGKPGLYSSLSPAWVEMYKGMEEAGFDVSRRTLGRSYLTYKEMAKNGEVRPFEKILEDSRAKAKQDYVESSKVLAKSDEWSAKLLGTMGGAFTDPLLLITLPFGMATTGTTILGAMGKAFIQESLFEAGYQAVAAPTVYAFKKELDIKTSIADEAKNALASIVTAGIFAGAGRGAYDLTAEGIKALRGVDPELADDYFKLDSGKATKSLDEHIENLHETEFGRGNVELKEPNERGASLLEADDVREVDYEVAKIEATKEADTKLYFGEDDKGEAIFKSMKEITDEIEAEKAEYARILECLRK